jgi:hypothetical protein
MIDLHSYVTNKGYAGYKLSNLQYKNFDEDNRFKVKYYQAPSPELGEASLDFPLGYRTRFLLLKRTSKGGRL